MDRHIWCNKRTDINYEEGFYIFGGMDETNVLSNDLYLLKPDCQRNKALIARIEGTFHDKKPRYATILEKITNYHGQPPCPRMHFGFVNLKNRRTKDEFLVIYGGRNDQIFESTNNVALNDICLFNICTRTWESLAIFG